MDFHRLLDSCKFLFHWNSEEDVRDLDICELHRDHLIFQKSFSLPAGAPPKATVSLKVNNVWYEHFFEETEWIVADSGQINGLRLLGPEAGVQEWKKNLEIGLCV